MCYIKRWLKHLLSWWFPWVSLNKTVQTCISMYSMGFHSEQITPHQNGYMWCLYSLIVITEIFFMRSINSCNGNEILSGLSAEEIIVFKWHCPIHSFVCPSLYFSEAHIRSYSKREMKQNHIHNGINLSSIRAITLNYIRPQPLIMHAIIPITVLFEQHWIPHALHAGHTGWHFYALVMFQNRQLLHHITYPNQNILQWVASIIIIMSCLHFLQKYSTGEFQVLQLIVLAAFGAVD